MKIPHILIASVLFVPMVSLAQITSDTEIMNIGGKSITKGEFEYTYRKNIQQQSEKTPLDEYVTLFGNYKLKVAEAEALGIDTTRQFITEFEGYRNQLVKPYMVDQNAEEQLAREAYDRLLEEVEASHILFRVDPSSTLEEKRSAYEKALKVREEAIKGTDFSELARRYSEDPSVQNNNGYLGYFGAFYMVYPFEKAAYETAVGEISMPIETQFGYHLIKVTDRRPTRALELSHIMLKVPQNAPDKVQKEREKEISQWPWISMLPFGILAGYWGDKEVRITAISEYGFQTRLAAPATAEQKNAPWELAFYDQKTASYQRILLRDATFLQEKEEDFDVVYTFATEQEDYRNAVQHLALQYSQYIRWKMEDDDAANALIWIALLWGTF